MENEIFATTFWTPWEDQKDKIGLKFEVLKKIIDQEDAYDPEDIIIMYEIKLENGAIIHAHPEEVILKEQNEMKKQIKNNKIYNIYIDTGVCVKASSIEEAIELAKKKYIEQIKANQVDYDVEERR